MSVFDPLRTFERRVSNRAVRSIKQNLMPKPKALLSLLTMEPTHTWTFGQQILGALAEEEPCLLKGRVGFCETGMREFSGVQDIEKWWEPGSDGKAVLPGDGAFHNFLFKGKAPLKSLAMFDHGGTNIKGHVNPASISYDCSWSRAIDFERVFATWVSLCDPILASLHLLAPCEQIFDSTSTFGEFDDFRRQWSQFQSGSLGYPLDPVPAYIGWATVVGEGFAERIDIEAIQAAGFPTEQTSSGWIIKLTGRLEDILDDFSHFSARRAELRRLFPRDFFLITEEPTSRFLR